MNNTKYVPKILKKDTCWIQYVPEKPILGTYFMRFVPEKMFLGTCCGYHVKKYEFL